VAAPYASKAEALKAEYCLKQLPRSDKLAFFAVAP
jgi:predicted GIY-YIG superfamily endonuclease